MNRTIKKRIGKKDKKKRLCLSILALIMLLFVPVFAYASEIKSDGKTTQAMKEENKTVRVGYFPYANFQEGGYGEHKQGAGYEYLQKISYITGWKYEYVYGSFKECLDMLADGEIDLLGSVSYTPERAESIDYSTYAEGTERYWIYTREEHADLADGDLKQMNGCRIGATDGSYQKELLEKWLDSNQIQAEVVICKGYTSLYSEVMVSFLFPDAEIKQYDTQEECLEAVANGKAGATVIPSSKINLLNESPLTKSLSFAEMAKRQELALFTTRENRRAATIINKAIEQSSNVLNGVVLAQNSVSEKKMTLQDVFAEYGGLAVGVSFVIIFVLLLLVYSLSVSRKKQMEALKEAQDANAANIAKTTFLNHMSHDIRTPMNAIVGFTDIAMKRKPDKEVENCLKKIRQSSEYLMTLINDVLDISRIESGKLEYKPVPVDFRNMTDTVLSIARGYIENRDLNFCVSREELKTPYVMADELRIREVLLNIISNAVKFTKDGGTISFAAENAPGNDDHHIIIRYRISDTGIGMSEEFQSRIFDEFTQENDGARTSYKGTGLGMAIAKKYVDLMGGKIEVSSRQGVGSTFTVEIPLRIAEQILTEKEEKLRKDMDLHGLHVLLAEDNDLNAEIAVSLLEEQGMIVTRAADGKSALLQFCNTAPGTFDLILMDIMMPEMNGYETTKAIRNLSNRPDGKEIPIIAMTANAFAEDVQAALDAGMDDHVAKPMDMDILISAIEKCVKR